MAAVPELMPVISPPASTVAFAVLLLLQVPSADKLLKVVVLPTHTVAVPVRGAGVLLTVTTIFDSQPPGEVYVIIVVPAVLPVTRPEASIVTLALLHDHVPSPAPQLNVVVVDGYIAVLPVIADAASTVITAVLLHPEGSA
jgi:hypothetical protein